MTNSGNLDKLGQPFQPWSSLKTSIILGENTHSDLSNYSNASYPSLFPHSSPMCKMVLLHMYWEPVAMVLSLPVGPESINTPFTVFCKLLASQMGFRSVLDPRDFFLCVHPHSNTMDWNHIYCFLSQRWRSWMLLSSFSRNKRLHFWNASYYQFTVQRLGGLVSTCTDPSLPGNSAGLHWDLTVETHSKSMCIITSHNSG